MKTIGELYELQKKLDARIIKEKGLEGRDLLPNTVLALQVEIAELANEWRGFKHWSNDKEPRGEMKVQCPKCHGEGTHGALGEGYGCVEVDCMKCDENCEITINPLLEEYVDCLHFFLSIARQLDLAEDDLYTHEDELEHEAATLFTELLHVVGLIDGHRFLLNKPENKEEYQKRQFRMAMYIFANMGEQLLGFEWEQIVDAYLAKNKVNHERQSNGY